MEFYNITDNVGSVCFSLSLSFAKRRQIYNFFFFFFFNVPPRIFQSQSGPTSSSTWRVMNSSSLQVCRTELCRSAVRNCLECLQVRLDHICVPLLWKVYEGLVYMDFSQKIMEEQGFGTASTPFLRKLNSRFICYFLFIYLFFHS